MKKKLWLFLLIVNMLYANQEVYQAKLGNGLKILVVPKSSSPKVLVQVWYGVGGKDEVDGHTGLSHILEHMMFTGTKTNKEFVKQVKQVGGVYNAMTGRDFTYYFEYVPADSFEKFLALEADRMQNLDLTAAGIKNELSSVVEERLMRYDNKPEMLIYEQAMASLYLRGAYHHFPIGWMSDIKNTKISDIVNWYQTWYAPNNALLVVAGPVDPGNIYKLANKYFGEIPAKVLPDRVLRSEVPLIANAKLSLKSKSFANDNMSLSYLVPSLKSSNAKDCYAISLLLTLLTSGKGSLFYQQLVDSGLLSSVGSWYNPLSMHESNLNISFDINSGKKYSDVLARFNKIIDQIAEGKISDKALQRSKAMLVSEEVFLQDNFESLVSVLARYSALGLKPEQEFEFVNYIKQVNKKDLQRVAKNYLKDNKYVMSLMLRG